jgi:hypothetical protein
VKLWVKRVGAPRYTSVKNVDLQDTVDDLTSRWVAEVLPGTHHSLVTLRRVPCGANTPTTEEEAAAVELDPRFSLEKAGVADGCSLLAFVASTAPTPGECENV